MDGSAHWAMDIDARFLCLQFSDKIILQQKIIERSKRWRNQARRPLQPLATTVPCGLPQKTWDALLSKSLTTTT